MQFGTCMFLAVISCILVSGQNLSKSSRDGKLFSLFNVVTFENGPCIGTQPAGGMGTCRTNTECAILVGGVSIGSCASGFGICCMCLLSSSTGGIVTENSTMLQSPLARAGVTDGMTIPFQVNRPSSDVCFLRLDLESFVIMGPADTMETEGGVCVDTFTATSKSGPITICGTNSGQHIFVDFGSNTQSTLTFSFGTTPGGTMAMREWRIRVDQISCLAMNTPPTGCIQYHTSLIGQIQTFNFEGSNGHLANQRQNVCIRQASGYCCVEYQVCPTTDTFSLDETPTPQSFSEGNCVAMPSDFVVIPGSSGSCSENPGTPLRSRYCGAFFNFAKDQLSNGIVCDCTPPFSVVFVTDKSSLAIGPRLFSRGACLLYRQVAC
ncbi:uncharacterized protein LOC131891508 isoform X2 [Tigriopus californicus]|uniref:uncharacterized protein LOC131891508 isoform X2 n=1 Tax=Tigriopus californicus TaxID=6832 RepID=UPI0027D9F866|nr:uncharacterized protein LOC131891508 isoform X2 [Tigriopus californicus]